MKKLIAMASALAICSVMCASVMYANSSINQVAGAAIETAEISAFTALCVEITNEPYDSVIHGYGDLDLTGLTISVYETDSDGNVVQTLTDATLDEARKLYEVTTENVNGAVGGGTCIITISAYSDVLQTNVSASDSFSFAYGAPLPETTTTIETTTTALEITTTTTTATSEPDFLQGDVNGNGTFEISDVVLLQKWLLAVPDTQLADWKAADFNNDERLDGLDLCLIRYALLNKGKEVYPVENPEVIDEFTPCTVTMDDDFDPSECYIIIKCQYSDPNRVWSIDDFDSISNIYSIEQSSQSSPYRQVLKVTLSRSSKDRLLKLIHDIEALNLVEMKEIQTVTHATGLPE